MTKIDKIFIESKNTNLLKKFIPSIELDTIILFSFFYIILLVYFIIQGQQYWLLLNEIIFIVILTYWNNLFFKKINNHILNDKIYQKHRIIELEHFYKVNNKFINNTLYAQFIFFIYKLRTNNVERSDIENYLNAYKFYNKKSNIFNQASNFKMTLISIIISTYFFILQLIYDKFKIDFSQENLFIIITSILFVIIIFGFFHFLNEIFLFKKKGKETLLIYLEYINKFKN